MKINGILKSMDILGTAPKHQFPVAVNDVKSTYEWLVNTMHIPTSKLLIGK